MESIPCSQGRLNTVKMEVLCKLIYFKILNGRRVVVAVNQPITLGLAPLMGTFPVRELPHSPAELLNPGLEKRVTRACTCLLCA